MIIDLLEWNVTYTDFVKWITENNIATAAISGYGSGAGFISTKYDIFNDEDSVAFKLKFSKEILPHRMGYTGTHHDDMGTYFAPYIPLNKDDA